ncbi:hypothetical protein APHAL10511_000871 [Amanita phalloides]|nr:hypothetical protein APHAL10511_000871 [Amanita phalloides]
MMPGIDPPMDPSMSRLTGDPPGPLKSLALIIACTLAMIVNSSNNTSVAIALPTIGRDLHILDTRLQLLVSAYSLSSACLLVLLGRLADLYGRKLLFMVGSIWLFAFTIGCGFAPNELSLEILRGFQGVGVAATIPASLGILANAFPISSGRLRSIAFATFAAGAPIGAFFGTCLGAILTQLTKSTWRSTFFLSAGLTAFYVVIGWFAIDNDEPSTEKDKRVDWLGGLFITAGLTFIIFVLSDGEIAPQKWATPYIIACIVLGCFFTGIFLVWQWYLERVQNDPGAQYSLWTPPPLMKLSLWTRGNGRFSVIMLVALLTWCCFLGWNIWATIYYQNYLNLKPIPTMLRFIPMFITGVILNVVVVLTIHRVSVIYLLGLGTFVTGIAPIFLAVVIPSAPYWAFGFPSAVFAVFGADFVFAAGTIYVAKVVKPNEQSLSGALFQTMTQIGTSIGVSVTTIVFDRVLAQDARKLGVLIDDTTQNLAPKSAQLKAYQAAQFTAFAFGMIATVFVLLFFRGVGIIGENGGAHSVPPPPGDASDASDAPDARMFNADKHTSSRSSSPTVVQPADLEKTETNGPATCPSELDLGSITLPAERVNNIIYILSAWWILSTNLECLLPPRPQRPLIRLAHPLDIPNLLTHILPLQRHQPMMEHLHVRKRHKRRNTLVRDFRARRQPHQRPRPNKHRGGGVRPREDAASQTRAGVQWPHPRPRTAPTSAPSPYAPSRSPPPTSPTTPPQTRAPHPARALSSPDCTSPAPPHTSAHSSPHPPPQTPSTPSRAPPPTTHAGKTRTSTSSLAVSSPQHDPTGVP